MKIEKKWQASSASLREIQETDLGNLAGKWGTGITIQITKPFTNTNITSYAQIRDKSFIDKIEYPSYLK